MFFGGKVAYQRALADTALAVVDGRIAAIGSDAEVSALVGPQTRRINLAGRTLLPGFQDAHVHPPIGGLAMLRCNLHGIRGVDAVVAAISRYAELHPELPWVVGSGWESLDFELGCPSKGLLDRVVPDRPAFLISTGGHDAWVNSRALAVAGIKGDTLDPPHGRIERLADNDPQGTLHEAAVGLVEARLPQTTRGEYEEAILAAQTHLHRFGITSWQDAWTTRETLGAYRALAERGSLTARVTAALWWERSQGREQMDWFREARATCAVGRLKATSVKIMQDGTTGNHSAALLTPYLEASGLPGDDLGMSFVEPTELSHHVAELDGDGFQVHFHAIGERAVREALDALEFARSVNPPHDNRHHIAHVCLVHPDDIGRFAALDVTANIQPLWAVDGEEMRTETTYLGDERLGWWYPFSSIQRAGGRLAGGSDWPVSSADPFELIQVAATRVDPLTPEVLSFLPHERLDLGSAFEAFTAGSAFLNHQDDTGSIALGNLADLVVADLPPDLQPLGLAESRVLMTVVEGEVVYVEEGVDW